MKSPAKVIKIYRLTKKILKIMKKIQINHRVEIQNNVLGFMYLILQITEFEDKDSKEIVEVRCYNLNTGNEVSRYTKEYALYPTAKKELKKIVNDILPC